MVSIVATYAATGSPYVVPSAMGKAAVLAMTRSLAVEWGPRNIRLNAELMTRASLARPETRTGSSHRRLDHPETDENWRRFVVVEQGDDGMHVSTPSAEQALAATFARDAARKGA